MVKRYYMKIIEFISIVTVLLFMISCGKKNMSGEVSYSDYDTFGIGIDLLTTKWVAPLQTPSATEGWDVVRCISDYSATQNMKYSAGFNKVITKDRAFLSILVTEEYIGGEVLTFYNLESVEIQSSEARVTDYSFSDLDYSEIQDKENTVLINELFRSGKAELTAFDTDGNDIAVFSPVGSEHFYKIRISLDGKVRDISDLYKTVVEGGDNSDTFIMPEMICGSNGEFFCIDYSNRLIKMFDEKGSVIQTVDAKNLLSGFQYVGKDTSGIPIFACRPNFGQSTFFYIDDAGEHVLFSGQIEEGLYSLDRYGNVLIMSGSCLYSWNVPSGDYFRIYDFKGLSSYQCKGMVRSDDGEIIICFDDGYESSLYIINYHEHLEKIELVLLTDIQDPFLERCAAEYSRTHPEVLVNVRQMDANDEFNWNRVLNDISKGTGPNLIYTTRERLDRLKTAGAISPLDEMIEIDVKDSIFKGALKIGEYGSKLYAIPIKADLNVLMISEENWSENNWTLEEAMAKYLEWKDKGGKQFYGLGHGVSPQKLFLYLCIKNIEETEFVDIENRTCSFQTDSFY